MDMVEKIKYGLSLEDIFILDCHCHIGYWHNFNIPGNTAEAMIISMDTMGINMAFITAHASIGPNFRFGNDIVIDSLRKYPGRFIGYATINPNYKDDIILELDRCFSIEGIKGIKLHPDSHSCAIDYRNYHIAYRYAEKKECPVLIHVWGVSEVLIVDKLAGQYPGVNFIMGHAGAEVRAMEVAADIVNRHDNVFVDTAVSRTYEGNIEWLVNEVGSKKILFGSDMPFLDPRPAFGRVALADISKEDKANIFGLNLKRILRLS